MPPFSERSFPMNTRRVAVASGGSSVVFDVNPAGIRTDHPQLFKKTELLGGGYISMGAPGLSEMTLSTFLPADGSPMRSGSLSQSKAFSLLMKWKTSGAAVTVTIGGVSSGAFYITAISRTVREGDRDWYIDIDLTERRTITRTRVKKKKPGVASSGSKAEGSAKRYTVKKGDTLWKIAKRFYGSGSLWRTIYRAN